MANWDGSIDDGLSRGFIKSMLSGLEERMMSELHELEKRLGRKLASFKNRMADEILSQPQSQPYAAPMGQQYPPQSQQYGAPSQSTPTLSGSCCGGQMFSRNQSQQGYGTWEGTPGPNNFGRYQ